MSGQYGVREEANSWNASFSIQRLTRRMFLRSAILSSLVMLAIMSVGSLWTLTIVEAMIIEGVPRRYGLGGESVVLM